MTTRLIQITIIALLSVAFFSVIADILKVPTRKAVKMAKKITQQQETTSSVELFLESLALKISKHIRIEDYKRSQLMSDLQTAGSVYSPEMYIAVCLVKSLIIGSLAIPVFVVYPTITPLILVAAVVLFFISYLNVKSVVKDKRARLEYELPKFTLHIAKTLKHNRDILYILDNYRQYAGPELGQELAITVADMKSSNYEAALMRFDNRVGSSMLSDITRGLIGVIRGNDTAVYWENLSLKLSDHQRQMLKQKALKIPNKVHKLSMGLMMVFVFLFLFTLGYSMIDEMGAIFNVG